MNAMVWPQGQKLPGLEDEYAEVTGALPEGSEIRVKKVGYVPDSRFPTNGFLVVEYTSGEVTRFRMKKSTAFALNSIMQSMMFPPLRKWEPPGGGINARDFERQYMGGT